jgi:hypothetical protein
MTFTKEQQKITLGALIVLIALVNGYHFMTNEKPKTAPLMYERGAVASSPVRQGLLSRGSGADPLNVFLERHDERYPGVARDFFRMENPVVRQKPAQVSTVKIPPPPPPTPEKTPEEIAAEASRADLSKFRFLGYLTDKESTLFLSKDGELFIVKSGDRVLKNYKVKEASKDFVVLIDTVTRVEMRIDMSGSVTQLQTTQQQAPQLQLQQQPPPQQPPPLVQQPSQQPAQPPVQDQALRPRMRRQMQKQEVQELKQEIQQNYQQQQ